VRIFFCLLLVLFVGCQKKPEVDVGFQLVGDELYVCFIQIQNLGTAPLSVSRINVNQEMDLPLEGNLKLSAGQKLVFPYRLYEWPQPHDIVLETNEGVYRKKFNMEWPKLAVLAEMERRSRNPDKAPVPAPADTPQGVQSVALRIEGRNSWPGSEAMALPIPSPPESTPTPQPSPTASPPAVISSRNPEYTGQFINRTSNQSGVLLLTFETFIPTSAGSIEVGGKMKLGTFAPFAVSGNFVPATGSLTLSQSSPVKATWIGTLSGEKLRGTFRGTSFGREEVGVWEATHLAGLNLVQATGVFADSPTKIDHADISGEYVAVPIDSSMSRFMLFSKRQNRIADSRVWEFERAVQPTEIVKLDGKTAVVVGVGK